MALRVAVQSLCQALDACQEIRAALLPLSEMGQVLKLPVDERHVYLKVRQDLDAVEWGRDYYKAVFQCWDHTMLDLFNHEEVDHE